VSQSHGRRYEHELATDIDTVTTDDVWVTTAGYSGNSGIDGCDLVVTTEPRWRTQEDAIQYNIEAKKRKGDAGYRVTVFSGSSGDETGEDELQRLVEGTPGWADPLVAIKFSYRQLFVADARWILQFCREEKFDPTIPPAIKTAIEDMEPRITRGGSISMIKPKTGVWPSASAGKDDGVYLADQLRLPTE